MTKPAPREDAGAPLTGTVSAAHGRNYRVRPDHGGDELICVTRGRQGDVVCGDRATLSMTAPGHAVIESVQPRSTLFHRADARRSRLIAANLTRVAFVVADPPGIACDLLDRCLIGAEHAGIPALIVLNKSDLPQYAAAQQALAPYAALGYPVIAVSTRQGAAGVAPLRAALQGQLAALVGASGVGKSSLLNALVPDARARTGEISAALGAGRHTTTHAQLLPLDAHSALIDTPGLQEFGLAHIPQRELDAGFLEFRPYLGHCRYADCLHLSEPDCAVTAAAAKGGISAARLASYRRMAASAR